VEQKPGQAAVFEGGFGAKFSGALRWETPRVGSKEGFYAYAFAEGGLFGSARWSTGKGWSFDGGVFVRTVAESGTKAFHVRQEYGASVSFKDGLKGYANDDRTYENGTRGFESF